ncbi:XRE family transcriptional regulator [Bosea sp. (in: a-proteobacteria)]|uniref:XRE family transcriptional regulator n=1 Tax=Bosea sp. (in: a-proteobacteria) TaxID=1871050 RepID=UPI003F70365F
MKVGIQSFRGSRLREARLARGLFKNALADLVGVTGTAIARYEDGVDKPQADKLDLLAKHLNFPSDFFVKPEWNERPEVVFWRSRAAETKLAREMTEQRMVWLLEVFDFLEREVDFPLNELPDLQLPPDFRLYKDSDIEQAAVNLRHHWKLWDLPIPDVLLALENAGIPVLMMDFDSDKQDGFFFRSPRLQRMFVGINSHEISPVRVRYDAAHELGHAVLHKNVTLQQSRDPHLFKIIEQQAHRFAGAFLFPESAFRFEVRAPTLDYFCSLKRRWGMSIGAMIYRAHDLGLIGDEERSVLYRNMTRRGWRGRLSEPFDRFGEMQLEKPRMLRRAIEVLTKEGILSKSSIRAMLALPVNEIERIAGVEAGFFEIAPAPELAVLKSGIRAVDVESGKIVEFPRRYSR